MAVQSCLYREYSSGLASWKTLASWNAHALSTRPGIPSRPTALRMFTRLKDRVTSTTEMESELTSSAAVV